MNLTNIATSEECSQAQRVLTNCMNDEVNGKNTPYKWPDKLSFIEDYECVVSIDKEQMNDLVNLFNTTQLSGFFHLG